VGLGVGLGLGSGSGLGLGLGLHFYLLTGTADRRRATPLTHRGDIQPPLARLPAVHADEIARGRSELVRDRAEIARAKAEAELSRVLLASGLPVS